MSTSKHIDRICVIAVVAGLLMGILFMNGAALGVQVQANAMDYEDKLFDISRVHTIDIVMDDWEGFLATAQSEEYTVCNVVIDGEAFYDVGIRGKGNTSLSTVASMDSDRYSFKIEFDQYDSAKSYYGLDKLSLNNLIQDNTMMKDYLTYQMMRQFGVAAPLCSYVYITVNGEDWGLYLAVEAVEESFLQRNFGSDYGELYKPDSMNMGGGRGNGKDFDASQFAEPAEESVAAPKPDENMQGGMPGTFPAGAQRPGTPGNKEQLPGSFGGTEQMPAMQEDRGSNMDSGDTKLQYIDDDPDSYSVIFDSAKTAVSAADQQRLIASLKALSAKESLESAVDMDSVLRYFVVHNFVVNGDSYTGSMIHNYYLYEEDGQLSMIPWDYNLAFGTFQGGDASGAVNDDIDAPLSVTGSDRPMIDWIFADETYIEQYHTYFAEFLNTVNPAALIAQAKEQIAPYVEKDPTKFCTYEEFEKGVETLSAFCQLRSQSVAAQLAGDDGAIDASAIILSDMGTMGNGMGGGRDQMPERDTVTAEDSRTPEQFPAGNTQIPGDPNGMRVPGGTEFSAGMENLQPGQGIGTQGSFPNRGQSGSGAAQTGNQGLLLVITLVILGAGMLFVFRFKR